MNDIVAGSKWMYNTYDLPIEVLYVDTKAITWIAKGYAASNSMPINNFLDECVPITEEFWNSFTYDDDGITLYASEAEKLLVLMDAMQTVFGPALVPELNQLHMRLRQYVGVK